MKKILFCIFLLPLFSLGQSGLHLQFMPDAPAGQFFQPALLADMEMTALRLSGAGSLWLNSSTVTYESLLGITNYLTDDFKQNLIADLDADNRFQVAYNYGEMLNFRTGKLRWGISWRNRWATNGGFDNPLTMGLVLRGNAPYAGQTIADQGVYMRSFRAWELGLSAAFSIKEKFKIGIRPKVLFGQRYTAMEKLDYSLFTAANGTRLEVNGTYDAFFNKESVRAFDQMGLGVDVGVIYDISEKWRIQLSAVDLGHINWQVERFQGDLDFEYEGINLLELLGPDPESPNFFITDTLRTLLLPDSSHESYRMGLPSQFSLAVSRKLGEKGKMMLSAHLAPGAVAPQYELPLVNLAYHHQFTSWLMLGINAYGGGPDQYGLGAVAMLQFVKKDEYVVNIFGSMDNALGVLIPARGQGSGLNVGASIGF